MANFQCCFMQWQRVYYQQNRFTYTLYNISLSIYILFLTYYRIRLNNNLVWVWINFVKYKEVVNTVYWSNIAVNTSHHVIYYYYEFALWSLHPSAPFKTIICGTAVVVWQTRRYYLAVCKVVWDYITVLSRLAGGVN